jgi:predicted transcriptional regulator YdeE
LNIANKKQCTPDIWMTQPSASFAVKQIIMTNVAVTSFYVIGMTIRTSNEAGQAAADIPALWEKFMAGNDAVAIPGIHTGDIYCVYTEYESDHTRPYTVVLGYKADSLDRIPEGWKGLQVEAGPYQKVTAKGRLADGIVYNAWLKIWEAGWNRAFTTDFELYGPGARDPEAAELDIFIAVKN